VIARHRRDALALDTLAPGPHFRLRFGLRPICPIAALAMPTPRRTSSPSAPSRGVTFSISELAREFALTTRAIRHYEDEGLIAPLRRGTTRIYGERERVRIKLILRGKRLGLALAEIRELFDLYEVARNERAQLTKFLDLLQDRRERLAQQKDDIDAVLAEIDGIERTCRLRLAESLGEGTGQARMGTGDVPRK
jgi:DNA-binding transcriptional MerR regulator